MIHLKRLLFHETTETAYPFSIPAFRREQAISFERPVTIFIGENGCGKSTLIDLIAAKTNLYRITKEDKIRRESDAFFRVAAQSVGVEFRLLRPSGFYFSAEDFSSYIQSLQQEKELAKEELRRVEHEYRSRSQFARQMASAPFSRTLGEIKGMYQKDLLTSSHGESYLDFFASRLRKEQLYLLDEPETPLSIQNQLTLIAMIDQAVADGCQFIIATHSPILMGIPDADIWEFLEDRLEKTCFSQIESVNLLRQYLNDPTPFFHHLRDEG
jgi:predicted ATPase